MAFFLRILGISDLRGKEGPTHHRHHPRHGHWRHLGAHTLSRALNWPPGQGAHMLTHTKDQN